MVSRWIKRFGRAQAELLMAANNCVPVHFVRVNPLRGLTTSDLVQRISDLGGTARQSDLLPEDFVRVEIGLQAVLSVSTIIRYYCLL
jgi:hypothetical protein